jgi:hypothetical protein
MRVVKIISVGMRRSGMRLSCRVAAFGCGGAGGMLAERADPAFVQPVASGLTGGVDPQPVDEGVAALLGFLIMTSTSSVLHCANG